MKASKTFQKAKTILVERGWIQGKYEDRDSGGVCFVGALHAARGGSPGEVDFRLGGQCSAAGMIVRGLMPNEATNWTQWNDYPGRTLEEVLGLLDKATPDSAEEGAC